MKKLSVLILILVMSTLVVFGCNAQRKPAPEKPEQKLIPQESTIGFSQIDTDKLPASIQKIASAMEDKPMVTWAHDNNNSYILLNTGEDDESVKVNKVIQRVPVQDFLWLDIQLDYTDDDEAKNNNNNRKLVAVKLDRTDKAINGVGFELNEDEDDEEEAEDVKQQTKQTPAPAPAPTPAPATREPANQAKPAPQQETSPKKEQPQKELPREDNEEDDDEQQQPTPAAPNDD